MPLHLAAVYPECSPAVLYHLLVAYPEGAKSKDYRWVLLAKGQFFHGFAIGGVPSQTPMIIPGPLLRRQQLPLHRACKARASLNKCLPLIESYPEALSIRDWEGKVGHYNTKSQSIPASYWHLTDLCLLEKHHDIAPGLGRKEQSLAHRCVLSTA